MPEGAAPGSLVRRLTLGAATWVGVLGLTVAALSVWQYWRASLRNVDARITEEAHALVSRITVSNGLLEIDIDAPVPADLRDGSFPQDRYYGVYDATGRLLDGTSPVVPDRLAATPALRTRSGYREVLVHGPSDSVVVVGESLALVYADVRRLAGSLLLASVVGAALALAVGAWLRRQLARSILQIDETARTLAPGQPTRIDSARVDEEFVGVTRTLNSAFDRLEQALARERQLTSDASHELRTPVTTLVAETQWALGRERTLDEYRKSLEVCARQGLRMKALVESLLTLARLEGGTQPPSLARVELRPLAEETIAELASLAAHHRVRVQATGEAAVWADPTQIRILLSNLLANAIRYNRPDGSVSVTVSGSDDRVELRVADTGPGLEPGLAAHVFERFWRADPSRSARDGGSGLGLAISKAIVDAHRGTIACESAPEKGTIFTVTLPSARGGAKELRHDPSQAVP
jgi:signal transduction histidine kinase